MSVESEATITSYRWYLDGEPIEGATSATWKATTDGNYQVELIGAIGGCRGFSAPYFVRVNSVEEQGLEIKELKIYPNPAQHTLWAQIPTKLHYQSALVEVRDTQGRLISGKTEVLQPRLEVNLEQLAQGYYILRISTDNEVLMKSFVIEK